MSRNRGSIVALNREVIKTIVGSLFFLPTYAEGPESNAAPKEGDKGGSGGDPAQSSEPVVNYEDLIAKARNEEKKKQYGTIEKLKTQVTSLTAQHNEDLLKIASLEEQVKATEAKLTTAGQGESEALTTLRGELDTAKKAQKKAEDDLKALQKSTVSREEVEKEIREELEKEFAVKTYRAEQLAAHAKEILVPELVMGDTKEAIDASIQSAITRSNEIRQSLGITAPAGQQTNPQQSQQGQQTGGQMSFQQMTQQMMTQGGRTPRSPASPSIDTIQDGGVSMEHLARMDVSSPEYAQLRKQLGLK